MRREILLLTAILAFGCKGRTEPRPFAPLSDPPVSLSTGSTGGGSGGAGAAGGAGGGGGAGGSAPCTMPGDVCEQTGRCVDVAVPSPGIVCSHGKVGEVCASDAPCAEGTCELFVTAAGIQSQCTTCLATGTPCENGAGTCVVVVSPNGFSLACSHGHAGEPCTNGGDCNSGLCVQSVTANGVARLCQ